MATIALALSPGPDNIFVFFFRAVDGIRYGFATMAGLMTGCLVHTSLLAFGVSAVIKNNPLIFTGIKVFGACYLLYLAWRVFRADATISLNTEGVEKKSLGSLFRQGFIMNVLNPKVTIFFLAFFPGFLFSNELSTVIQFYVLGLLFMVSALLVFGAIAVLAGKISKYLTRHQNAGVYLKWVQIIVFVGIAVYLFLSDK